MIKNIFLLVLCLVFGVVGYCTLAFGFSYRSIQTLGVPLIGMLVLLIVRYIRGLIVRRPPFLATFAITLSLAIVMEGFALARIAQRKAQPHNAESSLALKRKIQALVDRQEWKDIVNYSHNVDVMDNPEILLDIGYAYNKIKDTSSANAYYQRAIQLDPTNLSVRYELARLYETNGEYIKSAKEYERILEINDTLPDVFFAYGVLQIKLGNRDAAVIYLERAVMLYPKDNPLKQNAIRALEFLQTGLGL